VLVGAVDAVWFGSEGLVEFGAVAEARIPSVAAAACVEIGTSQRRNIELRVTHRWSKPKRNYSEK